MENPRSIALMNLTSETVILEHRGTLDHQTTLKLLAQARLTILKTGEKTRVRQRVLCLMTEILQNITRHASGLSLLAGRTAFLLSRNLSTFSMQATNPVENHQVPKLAQKLYWLQQQNSASLTKSYTTQLLCPGTENRAGAGLGLLDIARRAAGQWAFSFEPAGDGHSLFCLTVQIHTLTQN